MNPALQSQLRHLDRALLALADERARLLAGTRAGDPSRRASTEDLLQRYAGPLEAGAVRALFAAVDAACAPFAQEARP